MITTCPICGRNEDGPDGSDCLCVPPTHSEIAALRAKLAEAQRQHEEAKAGMLAMADTAVERSKALRQARDERDVAIARAEKAEAQLRGTLEVDLAELTAYQSERETALAAERDAAIRERDEAIKWRNAAESAVANMHELAQLHFKEAQRLREATPGAWDAMDAHGCTGDDAYAGSGFLNCGGCSSVLFDRLADASYIAAANPATIRALLQRLEAAEGVVAGARKIITSEDGASAEYWTDSHLIEALAAYDRVVGP